MLADALPGSYRVGRRYPGAVGSGRRGIVERRRQTPTHDRGKSRLPIVNMEILLPFGTKYEGCMCRVCLTHPVGGKTLL